MVSASSMVTQLVRADSGFKLTQPCSGDHVLDRTLSTF